MRNLKINKSLVVEIPKRLEKDLKAKFNLRRLNRADAIYYTCPLCTFYFRQHSCRSCPFDKFEFNEVGCINWIERITLDKGFTVCSRKLIVITDKEKFKNWRRLASKHIVFV